MALNFRASVRSSLIIRRAPGAYHSGDPADSDIDPNLLSGCALGIADVDDIEKVSPALYFPQSFFF